MNGATRKLAAALAAMMTATSLWAATAEVNGVTWNYTISNGEATITGGGPFVGEVIVPSSLGGCPVTVLDCNVFKDKISMTKIIMQEPLKTIKGRCFDNCISLKEVDFPTSMQSIVKNSYVSSDGKEVWNFYDCNNIQRVIFRGPKPSNVEKCMFSYTKWSSFDGSKVQFVYPREYAGEYLQIAGVSRFGGFTPDNNLSVKVLSSSIRESDPTVMDIIFKITSSKPTAKVRVLAFEDGTRSFAKVVRPETFVDGTAPANWDAVAANVEHTLSWRVSSDWATRLAKVKFEVMVSEGGPIPLETMRIPASASYGDMTITWNTLTASQWFDALIWLYADHDPGLTLANGVLKNGSTTLASGSSLSSTYKTVSSTKVYSYPATAYVLSKMGFSQLTGAALTYANSETRLGLSPGTTTANATRQYGYKIDNE